MQPIPLLFFIVALLPIFSFAQEFGYIREEDGIRILDGEDDVLFYQVKPKSQGGKFSRANYIHPLYGIDGSILTEDFPEDHPHHRGIFWAWHQVLVGDAPMGDAWECRDFTWDVRDVKLISTDTSLVIRSDIEWKSPDFSPRPGTADAFLHEKSVIRISSPYDGYRILDFEISLVPLVDNVKLGGSEDDKGYGGFSVRLKTPDDLSFTNATGELTPRETAISSGPWVMVSGALGKNASPAGVVIVSRNDFDKSGTRWILRSKASMQNVVFPGSEPVPLQKGEATTLRYSLIIFKGPADPGRLNGLIGAVTGNHE